MRVSVSSVPQSERIFKSLTPTQARLFERLITCPPEARNAAGRVPVDYLAGAWPGGTSVGDWHTLVYVNMHNMRRRLAPLGIEIVGYCARRDASLTGGYVVRESERAA